MLKLLSFIKGKVKRTTGKFKLLSFIKGPFLNGSLILIHDITQETSRTLYNTIANTTMMLLAGIFHLLQTARCSIGLNGSDPEQIEDRGWRLSLDVVDIWNTRLWQFTCVPAKNINTKRIKATKIWSTNIC